MEYRKGDVLNTNCLVFVIDDSVVKSKIDCGDGFGTVDTLNFIQLFILNPLQVTVFLQKRALLIAYSYLTATDLNLHI